MNEANARQPTLPTGDADLLRRLLATLIVVAAATSAVSTRAGTMQERDLRGRVIAVDGQSVTIALEGNLAPAIGDAITLKARVEGLEKLANLNGTWTVRAVDGLIVQADAQPGARGAPSPDHVAVVHATSTTAVANARAETATGTLETVAPDGRRRTVSGDVLEPLLTHFVRPAYPELARQARIQCAVIVEATIGATGVVTDAKIARGCNGRTGPMLGLHAAAVDAVRQWRYRPARLDGQPVAAILLVTINFELV